MKKTIEDLFQYPRTLNDLTGALEYIDKKIPLVLHRWKEGEKVWTWDIPKGGIQIGCHTITGKSPETIILPIHLDHPKQANDNLSGVVAAIWLACKLHDDPTRYTYKFLFLPETIGTMAWLSRYGTNYKYGIVIDSVGNDGDLITTMPKTRSLLDFYVDGKLNDFYSDAHLWSGNDERALESVGISSIQISRSPFLEYHTERDTPDRVQVDQINKTVNYVYSIIQKIEVDYIPIPKYQGVPCLSATGLWKKEYESPHTFMKIERIWHSIDGLTSIAQIARYHNLPFGFTYNFVEEMKKKGLVYDKN